MPGIPTRNIGLRHRPCNRCLFKKPAEHETAAAGMAAVEPESELLKVGLEMGSVYRALMGAQQPALEKTCDPVNTRHRYMGGVTAVGEDGLLALETVLGEVVVATPSVGLDRRLTLDPARPPS